MGGKLSQVCERASVSEYRYSVILGGQASD